MPQPERDPIPDGEIATSTLAEIYAQQGLHERALAIYQRIALRAPHDTRVAERIDDLTRRLSGEEPPAEAAGAGGAAALEIPVPADPAEPARGAPAGGEERRPDEPAETGLEEAAARTGPPEEEADAPPPARRPGPSHRPLPEEEFQAWLDRR